MGTRGFYSRGAPGLVVDNQREHDVGVMSCYSRCDIMIDIITTSFRPHLPAGMLKSVFSLRAAWVSRARFQ